MMDIKKGVPLIDQHDEHGYWGGVFGGNQIAESLNHPIEQLAKDQNNQLDFPTKSRGKRIKDLEKRLEIEIEKRNLRPLIKNEISDKKESIGLILETRFLNGELTNAASNEITNVKKSVIEIGVRIDW